MNPIIPSLRRQLLAGRSITAVRVHLQATDADPADKKDALCWLDELEQLPYGIRQAFITMAVARYDNRETLSVKHQPSPQG